jgi:hypothetical protein
MSAERKLLERTDDDEVRRTLVLAQRTAAGAIEEARAEASRIVEEARHEADTEETARREQVRAEVADLAERRTALQADVDALEAYVAQQRDRVREELARQLAALDAPAAGVAERPELSGVEVDELAQARDDLVDALHRASVEHVAPTEEDVATPPRLYDAADESGELDLRGEATQMFDVLAEEANEDALLWAESAEATKESERPAEEIDDDPFLTELRRAVTDESPLGPRDDDDVPPAGFGPAEDAVPSGRFRLRRGR